MIYIRRLMGLQAACESLGLVFMEKPGRNDFFIHVKPSAQVSKEELEASFHIHVFPESNIDGVAEGEIVSFRLATILPKDGVGYSRTNLAEIADTDEWPSHCSQGSTKEAARLFGAAVKSQTGRVSGAPTAGQAAVFKAM